MHTTIIKIDGRTGLPSLTHPEAAPGRRGPITTYAICGVPDNVTPQAVVLAIRQTAIWLRETYTIRLPHARGGVSKAKRHLCCIYPSSPRPWGCFSYNGSHA